MAVTPAKRDMNILILGETGVGKSTWINGFINFLTYETLADAENGNPITLIPSKFTVCDENFEEIAVTTGNDTNEVFQAGQSATQDTKVYPFDIDNVTIRLIDTPGIGDTRGVEQDKKNFENILATLSHHDEIHGICILLKPNNARLNVMFRFCVKELLTYLHRDASKNIIFCFTNSRGTFYRPGETMPALKKLLSENKDVTIPLTKETVYCFDSEAYRFLAAIKNNPPVNFGDDERTNFSNSWEKSTAETARMLNHIWNLTPHQIKSTLSLNHARQLVLRLARPLAEISRNIQTNKAIVEDERKQLEKANLSIEDLQKKKMTTRTEIEVKNLNYPKTVCSNSACVKIWTINDVSTTEYVTVCHDHCYLSGVQADSVGDPGLIGCTAMQGQQTCQNGNCGHSYREHLHVYYDSVQVAKQVEDKAVAEALSKNVSAKETKEKIIEGYTQEIQEYEDELRTIEKSSAKFAYFLKNNAITPYNDAMEQYLNHLIQEEEDKVARGGNKAVLDNLIKSKESYLAEKRLLDQEMGKGGSGAGNPPGPTEVAQLISELQKLKHSGKMLKNALQCVNHSKQVTYKESVVKHPHGEQGKKMSWGKRVMSKIFGQA